MNKAKNIIMIIVGITMITASFAATRLHYTVAGGFLGGIGLGMLLNGVMRTRSPKAAHESEIYNNDERNKTIKYRACTVSLYAIIPPIIICCVVFDMMENYIVSSIFFGIIILCLTVYAIASLVLNKKM